MSDRLNAKAQSIYKAATICDLTLPFEGGTMGREDILERCYQSGITYVSLTISTDAQTTASTIHNIANVRHMIRERRDRMTFVRSVAEIRAAKAAGKLALGFHFQGSNALEANTNLVELYYELGVRHMLLVY